MPRYIDADVLIEKAYVMEYKDEWHMTKYGEFVELADVENAPTADVVERKRGRWENICSLQNWQYTYEHYRCSNCGIPAECAFRHCPNCGAEMRGVRDDNNREQ